MPPPRKVTRTTPSKKAAPPPDPSRVDQWIAEMQAASELPRALMGGTEAMQAGGIRWLPKHPVEEDEDWDYRRKTARLRNYFRRTVSVMAGKLFAKPFQVEKPNDIIQNIIWDVDRGGTDVQAFAKDLLVDALSSCGMALFLVDRDRNIPNTAQADQQRRTGPYWQQIKIEDLISLRTRMVAGELKLTHLRFFQTVERALNEFETMFVQQIKVIEETSWRVFELQAGGVRSRPVWTEVDRGDNRLGFVPLVPVYLGRTGYFQAENPLADLADMNLEHYQIRSEQRRILQVNSFPMLVALNYDGSLDDIKVGPNSVTGIKGGDKGNADLKFVESQGRHLEAGRNEINDLVDQMRAFGAQFDKPGETGAVESASGRVIDAKDSTSVLQLWALGLKDSIELGLQYTDKYLGGDGSLERVGKVDMSLDFTHILSDKDLDLLLRLRQLGDISRPTLWRILRQNSLLPEDFDAKDEQNELDDELPDLIPPTGPTPGSPPRGAPKGGAPGRQAGGLAAS